MFVCCRCSGLVHFSPLGCCSGRCALARAALAVAAVVAVVSTKTGKLAMERKWLDLSVPLASQWFLEVVPSSFFVSCSCPSIDPPPVCTYLYDGYKETTDGEVGLEAGERIRRRGMYAIADV